MKNISRYRTCIMGFAALWIYYFHIGQPRVFSGGPAAEIEWFFQTNGFCGVDIFIFLSAFGLGHSFRRRPVHDAASYFRYLLRRLVRLYQVLIPVTLLMMLADNKTVGWFAVTLSLIRNFAVSLYDHLWYIPAAVALYAIAPFYHAVFVRAKRKGLFTLVSAGVSILLGFLLRNWIRPDLYAIVNRLPVFFCGFVAAEADLEEGSEGKISRWLWLLFLTCGNLVSWWIARGHIPQLVPAMDALSNVLIAPPLSVLLADVFSRLEHSVRGKGITFLFALFGSISLEFYAFQEWFGGKFLGMDTTYWRTHLLCFLATLTAALGVHLLIEKASEWKGILLFGKRKAGEGCT